MLDDWGSNTKNIKAISLYLFGKACIVRLKTDSLSFINYGTEVKGVMSGRIWGNKVNSGSDQEPEEDVIGVSLYTESEELTIPASDIEEILPA